MTTGELPAAGKALERIRQRHSYRPEGYCIMCRWPDGGLARWPCPDWLDATAALEGLMLPRAGVFVKEKT